MKIKDSLALESKPDTQNLKYMDNMLNKIDCRASYMETCIYEQPGVLICYILVQNHNERFWNHFYIFSECFIDCSEEINSFVPPHTRFHSYQWSAENSDSWTFPSLLAFSSARWPPPLPFLRARPTSVKRRADFIFIHIWELLTIMLLSWDLFSITYNPTKTSFHWS